MIGRQFVKRIKLLFGRTETIKTTFELNKAGQLVENIVVETHDPPKPGAVGTPDPESSRRTKEHNP
jgi:hypothetical protein